MKYNRIIHKIRSRFSFNDMDGTFYDIWKYIKGNNIKGNYVEFGVFKGASLISSYKTSRLLKLDRKFYGFDSFEGFEVSEKQYKKGDYRYSLEKVEKILEKNTVKNYQLIKSYYNKLKKQDLERVAFIFIDCDQYQSTKEALDFIRPYMEDEGVICFNDFYINGGKIEAERRAFEEFKKNNKNIEFIEFPQKGFNKAYIISKKSEGIE